MTHIGYTSLCAVLFSLVLSSCSGKCDEPGYDADTLVGYWAITHVNVIEHFGSVHSTYDQDVPPHGIISHISDDKLRWDILIFDESYVTIRGDMPNRPKQKDYDDTPQGMIDYQSDMDNWCNRIDEYTDERGCPVGNYRIIGDYLVFGIHYMGEIKFLTENEFTLKSELILNAKGDYRRSTYTYKRIYSLQTDGNAIITDTTD